MGRWRKRESEMKSIQKRWIIIAALFILVLVLKTAADHPFIVHSDDLPKNYYSAVQNQAKGLYSSRIPLVPIFVSIDDLERDTVFYTIHYFPFGTVGMAYSQGDGYNIEKPLTGW